MKSDDQREYEQLMRGHRSLRRKDAAVSDEEKIVTNEAVIAGLNAEIDRLHAELADRDKTIKRLTKAKAPKAVIVKPRAWLVSKADMHGNLYDALAWDNGGKPLGVSIDTPVPLYDDAAISGLAKTLAVSLPELAPESWNEERACGWNMCLYTVRQLNGIKP